jgi:hypothetical protein
MNDNINLKERSCEYDLQNKDETERQYLQHSWKKET